MCEDMKIPPYKNKSQFIVPLSGEIFAVCAKATEKISRKSDASRVQFNCKNKFSAKFYFVQMNSV